MLDKYLVHNADITCISNTDRLLVVASPTLPAPHQHYISVVNDACIEFGK